MSKSPHRFHPLGLPAGSVRALLTLLIVAAVIVQFVRSEPIGMLWVQTLMIALAHYFTSRRLVDLPPNTLLRLQAEGLIEREDQPLHLPRGSIRAIIVAAFIGLAGFLYWQGRLWTAESLGLLLSVFAYFLGLLSKRLLRRLTRIGRQPASRFWKDAKALVVLLLLTTQAAAHLFGWTDQLPAKLDDVTIAIVLFYFGSR